MIRNTAIALIVAAGALLAYGLVVCERMPMAERLKLPHGNLCSVQRP